MYYVISDDLSFVFDTAKSGIYRATVWRADSRKLEFQHGWGSRMYVERREIPTFERNEIGESDRRRRRLRKLKRTNKLVDC